MHDFVRAVVTWHVHDDSHDFYLFQTLRTPAKIALINLCFNLIGANLIFLIAIDRTTPELNCRVTALLLQYFLLAAFMVDS